MRTWGGLARVVISDGEREGAVEARAAQMSEPRAQSRSRGASLAALAQLGEQRRSGTVGMDPRAPPGAGSKSLTVAVKEHRKQLFSYLVCTVSSYSKQSNRNSQLHRQTRQRVRIEHLRRWRTITCLGWVRPRRTGFIVCASRARPQASPRGLSGLGSARGFARAQGLGGGA